MKQLIAEARVYQALGQTVLWERFRNKAQQLAGDVPLPAPATLVF
ncbi:hypothetical protein [Dyella acidisoli]|uniref:Uncharacterized protein n=1 Tax=Dyella acidisoli TaxID=1867834 RepID=A0ABQ5XIR1_9GAMM|nr:hypothetical protein [Dyella acidisoli]GLQ91574.1 hypothetical protein GCM10007901_05240 [Dyella acidisoli]